MYFFSSCYKIKYSSFYILAVVLVLFLLTCQADDMIEVPGGGKDLKGVQKRQLYLDNKLLNLQIYRLSFDKLRDCEVEFSTIVYVFDDFSTINMVCYLGSVLCYFPPFLLHFTMCDFLWLIS